ncbi:ACT domain-containing protein [Zostera marina]|uniref:ACT domain-containing protein ACR n=1 Tax=Zostera marina TaxID=29655 RepID=A0A0K9NN65_ZOSMR|nr:ACT domain-containing protein [Zostera marina]
MEWPGSLDEYEKLVNRINTPRVVIDNAVCATATLVKVDSARKRGFLLEAIQVLTDLKLSINKAYMSSDGRWFMDVFHVTDQFGYKLTDESVISHIEKSLAATSPTRSGSFSDGLTALELTGTDRLGLLSEVFAVLSDLRCNVVEGKVWTHNGRIASLIAVDPIENSQTINIIETRLQNLLQGQNDIRSAKLAISSLMTVTHAERRLHQMMFEDRDYAHATSTISSGVDEADCESPPPSVSVQNWVDREYSIVNIQCRDRPKLLFDIVCTLTDMDYVVFHGTIDTVGDQARQEFYIRHADNTPISSEAERQRVIQCLQASIERRSSEGIRLELCMPDGHGLLSNVTRTFRENSLYISRADISTEGNIASNVFYVTDAAGRLADQKTIESVREKVGTSCLKVNYTHPSTCTNKPSFEKPSTYNKFSIGGLVSYLGLIRSCS